MAHSQLPGATNVARLVSTQLLSGIRYMFAAHDRSVGGLMGCTFQLLLAPTCCPARSALFAVPAVLAELCWPAGAEGPSGARAHLAAVIAHDAEKLAQWLFASVAGPQVSPGEHMLHTVTWEVMLHQHCRHGGSLLAPALGCRGLAPPANKAAGVTRSLTGQTMSASNPALCNICLKPLLEAPWLCPGCASLASCFLDLAG